MRDASTTQITGNAEIQNIKQIMGLQHGKARLASLSKAPIFPRIVLKLHLNAGV